MSKQNFCYHANKTFIFQPIFVFDGDAPALKQQTLQSRRAAEHPSSQSQSQSQSSEASVKLSRNRLKSVMGECKALLTSLGFECVASQGEAEAMCAEVNHSDK